MTRNTQELIDIHLDRMRLIAVEGVENWLLSGNAATATLEQLDGIRCLMARCMEIDGSEEA